MTVHQDRNDCPQVGRVCRSPYSCTMFSRCMDLVKPIEELRLLACNDTSYSAQKRAGKRKA
jgi:hypothetical protein